ncbi:NPCBM/NEW2 domain-containing protein [Photobacterium salinisoli]|uniref:NPCBM/NEW2 domain-containing protein n=1 Tax=Photobacterium salinisoli TaxID=1616783 RepID=UPI000EA338F2|nr:NPCBM/NEW2 domain-containing protein [Photobacterium salinisoli]
MAAIRKRFNRYPGIRPVLGMLASLGLSASVMAAQGPGLGNLNYSSGEAYTQVSYPLVDDTTGFLPPDYPGSKHYGVNVMTMLNGYMVGIFAPDSGGGPGGWIALDASDPTNLSLVKMVYEPDATNQYRTGNGLRTAEFREPHSFGLSEGNLIAIQTGKGIEIWDWSDVNNPIQVSKLPISGVNFGDYNNVSWQLFWQAPYLYVARGNAGLTIVDTSNVNNPSIVKTIPTSQLGGFNVGPVFVVGNKMFLSSMETTAGFSILNLDDPETPTLEKTVSSLPEKYYASCWDGKYAFFGARSTADKLRIYDTTTTPMTLVHDQLSGFQNLYCNVQDNKLFLGNQDDISVLDITNISNIQLSGSGSLNAAGGDTDHGQVFPFGNMVWVGNDHGTGSGLIAHQAGPDNTPPAIVHSNPAIDSTLQPRSSRVGIVFSDSLLMESVNSNTFTVTKLGSSTPVSGTYSVNLGFANFTPDNQLDADSIYVVELDGIEDFAGNPLPATSYRFSTGSVVGHDISLGSTAQVTLGTPISFSASASPLLGGNLEYSWDFGDGTPPTAFSSSGSVSHTYSSPNHWNAIVTVRESGSLTTSKTQQHTVYNPLTLNTPTTASTIVKDANRVYAVNEDNGTVSAISQTSPFGKVWETQVGEKPRTLAIAPDGNLWVANQDSDNIKVLSPTGSVLHTINLPRASQPHGVVFTPDGSAALVTLQATGEMVKINPSNRTITGTVSVGQSARGIAVDSDSATALVTRFISPQSHAEVVAVHVGSMSVDSVVNLQKDTTTVDGEDRSRGIPNYLNAVTISPDGQSAWVPAIKANVDRGEYNEGDPNQALTFETTLRAITSQINLNTLAEVPSLQMDMDDRAQPKALVFSELGDYVYIALEGQNSVEVRDAYTRERASEIADSGKAPRGLVKAGNLLFVHNFLSRTISVHDLTPFENEGEAIAKLADISLVSNETMHPRVLAGKQIFYNASDARMTRDGYISCAGCHTDGDSDNRVWDFTDRGEGLRNTISLLGRVGMGNGRVHWTANFDEIHDFENDIRLAFQGVGFLDDAIFALTSDPLGANKAGYSADLDNLAFYVSSLNQYPRSPYRNQDGSLTAAASTGKTLFTQKGCDTCHSGDFYTDNQRHDVGTIQASSGQGSGNALGGVGFDTPTLIGVWSTPPYFHNGQAATLNDVLQTGSQHSVSSASERAALVAYLEQIEYEGPEIVVPEPPAEATVVYLSDLTEVSSSNGWGPFEKDASNGEAAADDGGTISIGGTQYQKGLGVHAESEVVYDISGGNYTQFRAFVGVDDEVGGSGSVVFEVWVDGVLSYQSGTLTGSDTAQYVSINLNPDNYELKLVVTGAGNGVGSDHASWGDAKLLQSSGQSQYSYLSDMTETGTVINGWGPLEKDTSNGEELANDGNPITIGGSVYSKGLGVHADSTVTYTLVAGEYDQFQAVIGVDDEVGNNGSVVFEVWLNGSLAYQSVTLTGSQAPVTVNLPIPSNVTELKLVVGTAGDGDGYDHADWADARLRYAN